VSLATGLEHRREGVNGYVPPGYESGWQVGNYLVTTGHYEVTEGFVETVVPLAKDTAWARSFDLNGAVRATGYSTSGYVTTWKVGATWQVIDDIRLRATRSRDIRAPNLQELFQNGASNTNTVQDRANANAVTSYVGFTGGNPNLQPETAKTYTIGTVINSPFESDLTRNLRLSLDYYNIKVNNLISAYGTQFIVNKCYGASTAQDTSFCPLITRDGPTGAINRVIDTNTNVGELLTTGFDLGAQYSLPTDVGRFLFRFNGTYLLKYDYTDPSGLVIHGAGNYDGQGSVIASGSTNMNPRVKFNAGINYSLAGFNAGVVGHFIGPLTECSPEGGVVAGANTGPGFCYQHAKDPDTGVEYPSHSVDPYMTFDALVSYRLISPVGGTTLALGVRNLFNKAPPRLYDSFLTYADPSYDFVGRYFYGRIEHKF